MARLKLGEELRPAIVATIQVALEAAGVVFLDANGNGPGVALRAGEQPRRARLSDRPTLATLARSRRGGRTMGDRDDELARDAREALLVLMQMAEGLRKPLQGIGLPEEVQLKAVGVMMDVAGIAKWIEARHGLG